MSSVRFSTFFRRPSIFFMIEPRNGIAFDDDDDDDEREGETEMGGKVLDLTSFSGILCKALMINNAAPQRDLFFIGIFSHRKNQTIPNHHQLD